MAISLCANAIDLAASGEIVTVPTADCDATACNDAKATNGRDSEPKVKAGPCTVADTMPRLDAASYAFPRIAWSAPVPCPRC